MTQLIENIVIEKYKIVGIEKGSEFLLPPKLAISFIQDLSQQGLLLLGVTTWKYVDLRDGGKGIAQDLAHEFDVSADVIKANDIEQSAQQCLTYVRTVAEKVDLISIDIYFHNK